MSAQAFIGTSGWSYGSWKDSFYSGIAKKEWLSFYARQLTAIEVNATFYGLQKRSTFKRWRDMTPPDFRFSIKGNRFLTHNKKLLDPQEPIGRERDLHHQTGVQRDGLGPFCQLRNYKKAWWQN